jgi:hypothetical protein
MILSVIFHCYNAQSFLITTVREAAQPFCKITEQRRGCAGQEAAHDSVVSAREGGGSVVGARAGGGSITSARERAMRAGGGSITGCAGRAWLG